MKINNNNINSNIRINNLQIAQGFVKQNEFIPPLRKNLVSGIQPLLNSQIYSGNALKATAASLGQIAGLNANSSKFVEAITKTNKLYKYSKPTIVPNFKDLVKFQPAFYSAVNNNAIEQMRKNATGNFSIVSPLIGQQQNIISSALNSGLISSTVAKAIINNQKYSTNMDFRIKVYGDALLQTNPSIKIYKELNEFYRNGQYSLSNESSIRSDPEIVDTAISATDDKNQLPTNLLNKKSSSIMPVSESKALLNKLPQVLAISTHDLHNIWISIISSLIFAATQYGVSNAEQIFKAMKILLYLIVSGNE